MANDLGLVDTHCRSDRVLDGLRILSRAPRFYRAVLPLCYCNWRLHRSMREHRRVVVCFVRLGGLGEGRVDVAAVTNHFAGFENRVQQELLFVLGTVSVVGACVPVDLQFFTTLHDCPGAVTDHRDAAELLKQMGLFEHRQFHGLSHALDLHGCTVIEALDLAPVNGRALDHRVQHAGHLGVDAKGGLASHDVVGIENRNVLANQLVLVWRLVAKLVVLGDFHFGCDRQKFRIGQNLLRFAIDDRALRGGHVSDRAAPFLSSSAFKHRARRRPGLVHCRTEIANRTGAVRILRAVLFVA